MGWGAVLAGIGAGVGGFFLGGPAGAAALGTAAYQAVNAHSAEKNAEKSLKEGAAKAEQVYSPYNTLGLQAGGSLASMLGLEGLPAGATLPAGGNTAPLVNRGHQPDMPNANFGHRGYQSGAPLTAGGTLAEMMDAEAATRGRSAKQNTASSYGRGA